MDISDSELIKSILSGNQDAFSELVSRYKKLVYSVIFNFINDKEELPDICQEVFIRIYRSLGSYNADYKFATWTIKITTNYCLDRLRRHPIKTAPLEDAFEIASGEGTPEDQYLAREKADRIRRVVNELPEKYRVPLILFHQNGVSYEEMAKVLNEPMTIIKNRLYRARLMLREALVQSGKEGVQSVRNEL